MSETVSPAGSSSGPELVLRGLFWWVVILASLAMMAYLLAFVNGQLLHLKYPYNTILFIPHMRFGDFTTFYTQCKYFGTAQFWAQGKGALNYPAPAIYILLPFFRMFPHNPRAAAVAYDASIAGLALLAALWLGWSARRSALAGPWVAAVLLTLATSYPLMFMADRGNVEGAAWVAAILGIWAFVRGRHSLAAIGLASAAAIKLTPLILLLLFLRKRDWKNMAVFGGTFIALNGLAMWFLAPSFFKTFHYIVHGIAHFQTHFFMIFPRGIGVDHSLFAVIKQPLLWIGYLSGAAPATQLKIRVLCQVLYRIAWVAAAAFLVLRFRRLPMLNCIFAVFIVQMIAPPQAYDYTLLYLYIPWAIFMMVFMQQEVYAARTSFPLAKVLAILVPCAMAFTPQQNYLVLPYGVSFAGQVKALALLYLLIVVSRQPMPCRVFGEEPASPPCSPSVN